MPPVHPHANGTLRGTPGGGLVGLAIASSHLTSVERKSKPAAGVSLYCKPGGQAVNMNKLILIPIAAGVAVALDIAPLRMER